MMQVLTVLIGSLLLFLLGISLVAGGYQALFSGRILPGVSMAGVDLSNLTPQQATEMLNQHVAYVKQGKIVFHYGQKVWTATPEELGMVFDVGTSVKQAYALGRSGGPFTSLAVQLDAWRGGLSLPPVVIIDERKTHFYLQGLARQIDQPIVEADLQLNGSLVTYTPGQVGRLLNVDDTLKVVLSQMESFKDGDIQLAVTEHVPDVMDGSTQAQMLRNAVNGPLTLTIADPQPGDPGPWTIAQSDLTSLLSVGRVKGPSGWQYQVSLDTHAFDQFLTQLAPTINKSPQNATFGYNGGLVLRNPSAIGRTLDIVATRQAISDKLFSGEHTIPLVLKIVQPAVKDDATAASLGITGNVYTYTSYFRGSSSARMQNIQAAADKFRGLLVAPNSTFSMAQVLGDVSLENGYAEALIIFNGHTITGVGGGVCQVSTTLFRTAFYNGYPIVERHEHAFRVSYYEETDTPGAPDWRLAGLDATVYVPLVDLKFTNDRPYWLLMDTYFDPENYSLTWTFVTGDDGRTTQVKNLGLQNVIPAPDPLFVEDPSLPAHSCLQTDYPADGADITVTRVVNKAGKVLFTDSIKTQYEPWQAVYNFGPGTNDPQSLAAQGMCSH
jgi:vancomycin resistance protein YoaR